MFNATLTNVVINSAETKSSKSGNTYMEVRGSVGTGVKVGDDWKREWVRFVLFGDSVKNYEGKLSKGVRVNVTGKITVDAYVSNKDNSAQAQVIVNYPSIEIINTEGGSSEQGNAQPAKSNNASSDAGFMNIPTGIDEELPFA